MYPPSLLERTCLRCEAPLTGRADKKFCSSACKASYSRALPAPDSLVPVPAANQLPVRRDLPTLVVRAAPVEAIDWQARCEQAERIAQDYAQQAQQAQQRQQAALGLEQEYDQFDQLLKQVSAAKWSLSSLAFLLPRLHTLREHYQQHPSLTDPLHAAPYRLASMNMLLTYLQGEYQHLSRQY